MRKLTTYLSFVRFSHSVFALPFALTGALLAWREQPFSWLQVAWIVVCMVSARSAAMGFNRLVDAKMDALNPRTAMRELPRGLLSKPEATAFVVVGVGGVRVCGIAPLTVVPRAVADRAARSCSGTRWPSGSRPTRRCSSGLALAIAPVGGWIAAGGRGGAEPWLLGLAIGSVGRRVRHSLRVSGRGLRSPARPTLDSRDLRRAERDSPVTGDAPGHRRRDGLALVGGQSARRCISPASRSWRRCSPYEQSLVSDDDLSQVKRAFDLNGWVGIVYFAVTALALYVG